MGELTEHTFGVATPITQYAIADNQINANACMNNLWLGKTLAAIFSPIYEQLTLKDGSP